MAKYRGKHNGQTRGEYKQTRLYYRPRSEVATDRLFEKVGLFLAYKGVHAAAGKCTYIDGESNFRVYHMAGATISFFTGKNYEKPNGSLFSSPKHWLHLDIISNSSLDDVVKRISDNFPFFKEQTTIGRY